MPYQLRRPFGIPEPHDSLRRSRRYGPPEWVSRDGIYGGTYDTQPPLPLPDLASECNMATLGLIWSPEPVIPKEPDARVR